jgi:proteasome assembly chaperone 2
VIILTSSFGHEKHDDQIRTTPFRYSIAKNVTAEFKQEFKNLSWKALESIFIDDFNGGTILQIHGGGFAKSIFDLLQKNNVNCIVLLKFCSEGDNIPDAVDLINCINCWLQLIKVDSENMCKLKFPPSWSFLFGNCTLKEMY